MAENNSPRTISQEEFTQLQETYRRTTEQLNQMKGTLDAVMVTRNQPQPPSMPKTRLTPEAQEDVVKLAQHLFSQNQAGQQEQFRQAYNSLWERTDLAEFKSERPGQYDKYKDKIEALRQDKMRSGQFITRDEAYKFVVFDETGKKPKEAPVATKPPEPVFDPYLNKWVLPASEVPAQVTPPAAQQVQPPAQNTPAPNPTVTLDGVQNDQGEDFNLPPQGSMKSTVATPPSSTGPINVSVDSPQATLDAFEAKYGDVPL
jgi:hypothetical protein